MTIHPGFLIGALLAAFLAGWLASEALFRWSWRRLRSVEGFDEVEARFVAMLRKSGGVK